MMRLNRAPNPNPSSAGTMNRPRRSFLTLAIALLFTAGAVPLIHAQMTTIQNGARVPQNPQIPMTSPLGPNSTFQERRIRELNVERQKEMVADTDKLLKLTAELNADIAQTHSTSFTPDQLRLLARIEKLAKSVKDKMSNPVQGTIFDDSFPPPMSPAGLP
jgi:hypothetical protein